MTRDALVDGYTIFVGDSSRASVPPETDGGLYHRDTRHLSELEATIEENTLAPIGRDLPASNRRTVVSTGSGSTVNRVDEFDQKRSDLVVRETQTVHEGRGLFGRLSVMNHAPSAVTDRLTIEFDVDFADVFEIRGFASGVEREIRTDFGDRSVEYTYGYEDAEGRSITRTTTVSFDPEPTTLEPGRATFDLALDSQERSSVGFQVLPGDPGYEGTPDMEWAAPSTIDGSSPVELPKIRTGEPDYDRVFARAGEDLAALTAETDHGPVPLAGAPWFATVFGRDSLIAAYQALPVWPSLARGTLRYLAAHQGTTSDSVSEEEPGKVFHEMRHGELARRGLVPHSPYYGSVDATPLWIVVLAELHRWTGNADLVYELSDSLTAALEWIDAARSAGDDPFLYYESSPTMGLLHKAWRDTPGSVQFPDGENADPPIASVEVQGYVYRALQDAADLSEGVLGESDRAMDLREAADQLAAAFEETFWLPDREYYAVAKTADRGVVPTETSNVGHCLWAGIVSEDRAASVAGALRSGELFSGWGVRTMATTVDGYSPVSYHLGSVWPHDTALAALGLARYGYHETAERLARAVLDASSHFDGNRIPELYCGFGDDIEPKPYPSSCVPQAWSAGAPLALLRAVFDVSPREDGVHIGHDPELLDTDTIDPIRKRWDA